MGILQEFGSQDISCCRYTVVGLSITVNTLIMKTTATLRILFFIVLAGFVFSCKSSSTLSETKTTESMTRSSATNKMNETTRYNTTRPRTGTEDGMGNGFTVDTLSNNDDTPTLNNNGNDRR